MKRKLYGNTKRMGTIFCICILVLTIGLLVLRLSVFKDMAAAPDTRMQSATSGLLSYTYNSEVYFSKPDAKGLVMITSNKSNEKYYMSIDIQDAETGKTYLQTGLLEPGKSVDSLALNKNVSLKTGIYPCVGIVTAYDLETREQRGEEEIEITLYVGIRPDAANGE